MAVTAASIVVDPSRVGLSLSVTMTSPPGAQVEAYTTENGSSRVTWPQTVSTTTTFHIVAGFAGPVVVSATANGVEVAGGHDETAIVSITPGSGTQYVTPELTPAALVEVLGPESPGFTSTYVDSLFIPARFEHYTSVGTAAAAIAGSRFAAYGMPDAADQQINTMFHQGLVAGWSAMHIDLWHSNPNASGGDVVLLLTSSERGTGDDLTAGDVTLYSDTLTVGAQHILTKTRLAASVAINPAKLRYMRLLRDGDAVGDTLAGTWNILGWEMGKA